MCRVLFTGGAGRLLGETGERFGFSGSLASWALGWRARLAPSSRVVRQQPIEQAEPPHQSDQHGFVEKQGRYHGTAPSHRDEIGAFYWVFGLRQLSASWRYTTERSYSVKTATGQR